MKSFQGWWFEQHAGRDALLAWVHELHASMSALNGKRSRIQDRCTFANDGFTVIVKFV
jgi:hypothetical protein